MVLSSESRDGRYEFQSWHRTETCIAKVYARRAKASQRLEAVIASRSLRSEASTVANSLIEGANAFCGIGCAVLIFVDAVARGGRLAWCSGGACLDSESEENEEVSLFVSLAFVSAAVASEGTLTEAKRRSSSSRLRAQSFM